MSELKPLFVPLKKKYYEAFECGDKGTEYRAYGPRWNERTCYPGRHVVLSCGYGKGRRIKAIIDYAEIVPPTQDFLEIYGNGKQCFAITLIVEKRAPDHSFLDDEKMVANLARELQSRDTDDYPNVETMPSKEHYDRKAKELLPLFIKAIKKGV